MTRPGTRISTTPRILLRQHVAPLARAGQLAVFFSLHFPLTLLVLALLFGASPVRALGAGDKAADFEAPLLGGTRTLNLKQHRGKVVYLDFWASWCDPCQTALPLIEKLRGEFPKEKFQVLAVNVDKDTKAAKKFLQRTPVGYPSVSDPRGKLPRLFGLETMPTSYLIDRNGVIRYVHKGFREEDIPELRAQIAKLVAGK